MVETALCTIRPETPADYAAVADLHARAFGGRWAEATIVALLRQRAAYDPALSLVAEREGVIVGHAMFSPYTVRLLEREMQAVNLAPLAVLPEAQRQGIGGALLERGHKAAAERGFAFSFLLGHPSYYPRFGYRTGAFGAARTPVIGSNLPQVALETREPVVDDIPALVAMQKRDLAHVDFSLRTAPALLEWISPNPRIASRVYVENGRVVGYTRIHESEPISPRIFLAEGPEAARKVAATIGAGRDLVLPVHPRSSSGAAFGAGTVEAWQAAMVLPLQGDIVDEYFRRMQERERLPGAPIWPVAFDLA